MTLPGLMSGNGATESLTDSEAVQRTMELLAKTTHEFQEADMRKKLKECQGIRTQAYQHKGDYVEGEKVWYQPLNGRSQALHLHFAKEDKVCGCTQMGI